MTENNTEVVAGGRGRGGITREETLKAGRKE